MEHEHQQAEDSLATERYLLGEMTPEERGAFEEHFFDCSVCSQSVRDGSVMIDSYRAVHRESQRRRPSSFLPRVAWSGMAASIALASVVGYQSFVISNLRAPMLMQEARLESGMRSAGQPPVIAPNAPVVLSIYVDPQQEAVRSYRVTIRRADGTVVGRPLPVTVDQLRDPLPVQLPAGLRPGSYEAMVEGISNRGNAVAVAKYPFVVR